MRAFLDRIVWAVAGISTTVLVLVATGVVDAGTLDPPGPPGPTMKSLDQIEPRTPISTIPFSITQPGAYYLTGNVAGQAAQHGITIASDNVTLDLSGFSLVGEFGSFSAVRVDPATERYGIVVRNGTATGWATGFDLQAATGGMFDSLVASLNSGAGIRVDNGAVLSSCTSTDNGGVGIIASKSTVSGCTARRNNNGGFSMDKSVLTDCVSANNFAEGITGFGRSRIEGCAVFENIMGMDILHSVVLNNNVFANGGWGIWINDDSIVTGNRLYGNGFDGIRVDGRGSYLRGNNSSSNGNCGAGYLVAGDRNHIESNFANGAGLQCTGFKVWGVDNVVIGNTSVGHSTANYDLLGASDNYGPVVTDASAATNPLANLE